MTREEAIKILKSGSTFAYDEKEAGEFCEAYDMAITALEAQDVDAVSRQAVMWMLTNLSYTQCRTQGEVEVIGLAKTMLICMPSAQEVNNSNQEVNNSTATQSNSIKGRVNMISRQAAIDAVMGTKPIVFDVNRLEPHQRTKDIVKALELLPSAQPEPCDVCAHKDDCGDMRIYCPAERRTDDGE